MKIFNWVQRKLHQNVIKEKDGSVKNAKKKEASEIDKNTKAILEQVGFVDVLENWVDGVLAIGTFGFDTLKYSDDKANDDFSAEEEEEEEEVGRDGYESEDRDDGVGDDEFTKNSVIIYQDEELDPLISGGKFDENTDVVIGSDNGDDDVRRGVETAAEFDGRGKKRRTTLAELFMEDGDAHFKKRLDPLEIESSYVEYKLNGSKLNHLLFAKKFMSRAKDQDPRPIKKLHQMMKRMLKRKIHPDVDVAKVRKSDGPNKPIKKIEDVESIYLLNIPDPVV